MSKFICSNCSYIFMSENTIHPRCPKCEGHTNPVKKVAEAALLSNNSEIGRIFAESYIQDSPKEQKEIIELMAELFFPLSE